MLRALERPTVRQLCPPPPPFIRSTALAIHDLYRANGTSQAWGPWMYRASHPAGTIHYIKLDRGGAACSVVRNPHWIWKGDTQTANGPSQIRRTGSLPTARRLSLLGRTLPAPILTIIAVKGALSTFCLGLRNPGPSRSQAGKSDPKRLAGRIGEGEGHDGWVGDSGIDLSSIPVQCPGLNLNNRQALAMGALAWLSARSPGSPGRARGAGLFGRDPSRQNVLPRSPGFGPSGALLPSRLAAAVRTLGRAPARARTLLGMRPLFQFPSPLGAQCGNR